MKQLSHKDIKAWMQDRTLRGINSEEAGSMDYLEDADDFTWFATVNTDEKGRKVVYFTTSQTPEAFAIGTMTKTGRARILWN